MKTYPLMKPLAVAALMACSMAAQADTELGPYSPVTDARLSNPEPANWLHYRGNYAGWGYSPLDKITAGNVGKLKLAWSLSTGQVEGHQSPPIVNNGYMYVTTPGAQVIAMDAASGVELWRWKKELPADMMQLHPTNRGVALYGDKVYVATVDAHLVALDARTGKVIWTQMVGDAKALQYITLAPLAAKGKIMVGSSGGETGVRGFVAAFDAATGKEAWRTYTTAAPGEPGGNTWPGESYKNGGGSIWITGTYEPATNLAYWGTGNPAPWPTEGRKGDKLCSELSAAEPAKYKKSELNIGYPTEGVLNSLRYKDGKAPAMIGELQAWDLKTGKMAWVHKAALKFEVRKRIACMVSPKWTLATHTSQRPIRVLDDRNCRLDGAQL